MAIWNLGGRFKKTANAETMIRKLLRVAEKKSWRARNAPHLMKEVYDGKQHMGDAR